MRTNLVSPEAYISIGKNRQKIYGSNTVYLSDKQEFEFEFFNPTKDNVMAKISINGKLISSRGLILRPGVRGWIERYIDENRKFLFETYTVDGNSSAVKKAIEDNGNIKIEFYKEKEKLKPSPSLYLCKGTTSNVTYHDGSCCTYTVGNTTMDLMDGLCDYNIGNAQEKLSREIVPASFGEKKLIKRSKSIETGRVEKGSCSGQQFQEVDIKFEYFPFHTVSYKLMPVSQKPAEFNDLKLKCKHCGAKIKSNWKVCPICTNSIDDECKCSKCGTKVESAWKVCPICGEPLK